MATAAGTFGATLTAAVALWFTAQSLRATNNQYALSEQVAVTDRFRLAAEQLASDKINVRISGIYLLERLAKDSTADHATVFSVLEAFVRTQTGAAGCDDSEARPDPAVEPPSDIQTALTVIGRRDAARDGDHRVDLSRTCLNGATLTGARLAGADLTGVRLIGATLGHVDLTGAKLSGTRFAFADLTEANLGNDDLTGTDLHRANLTRAPRRREFDRRPPDQHEAQRRRPRRRETDRRTAHRRRPDGCEIRRRHRMAGRVRSPAPVTRRYRVSAARGRCGAGRRSTDPGSPMG
ncbi:pentapeptide repeat-containing protein [Nocardia nova]|uniref:pentapeptide repeat-containing protein n=1 Tax=Nocardia nova TaxID=37330 RepID=UPI0018962C50|nr:pentapeptide repeat-containing protein [Nocardia nova]